MKAQTIPAFQLEGKVESVLIAHNFESHLSQEVQKIDVLLRNGIRHDNHNGRRLADAREKELLRFGLPKRIEIANHREFSAISIEEMHDIATALKIPSIPRGILGENIIFSGIPSLTRLPSGTLLFFKKGNAIQTAVLAVWGENTPCHVPGEAIQKRFPATQNLKNLFIKSAVGKRGIVGSVYSSGVISVGDTVVAKIPQQHTYFV